MIGVGKNDPHGLPQHGVNMSVTLPHFVPSLLPLVLADKISPDDCDQAANQKCAKGESHEDDYSAAAGTPLAHAYRRAIWLPWELAWIEETPPPGAAAP